MYYLQKRGARELFLALLCLFFVAFPLVAGAGPVNTRGGGDSPFLLVRLEQLVAGLRAGALPVRWMPDAAYGLGYPFFTFYAALPYWLAAGLRILGWGPIAALQVTQILGFVLAAASMALLAQRVLRRPAAVALAVAAYTCAPFHMANVYVRGDSLSEFFAFVWYPLIVWSLLSIAEKPSLERTSVLAFSYGALILTHNLSAILFSPFVALLALWLWISGWKGGQQATRASMGLLGCVRGMNGRVLAWMLAGGLLGLALSATLWLTVVVEMDAVWMGVKDIQTSGYFDYAGHFRALLPQGSALGLVQPHFLFRYEVAAGGASGGGTPFAMGAVQAALSLVALVVCGIGAVLDRRRATRTADVGLAAGKQMPGPRPRVQLALFWILGFGASTFMITPASRFLWDHLPVLPIAQFPWRFLSVQAFFGALLIGTLVLRLARPGWVALGATVLLTVAAVGALRPEYLPISEGDVIPERLALFESFTGNIGTTIRGEYLPADVEPGLLASAVTLARGERPQPLVLEGEVDNATLLDRDARSERWQVTVGSEAARLAFHTLAYPGWHAEVDGCRASIDPLRGSGLISLVLPQGEHRVVLRFGRTAVRWVADGVSLAALVLVVALFGVSRLVPAPWGGGRSVAWRAYLWAAAQALLVVCIVALVGRVLTRIRAAPADDDWSMDFDRMPFVHHNPGGIDFGLARLLSYDVPRELEMGEGRARALTVSSQWNASAELEVEVLLVSPVDPLPRPPLPPPLAGSRLRLTSRDGFVTLEHVLTVPPDIASGMYYLTVRVWDGADELRAQSVRGERLGQTYLYPVWIKNPRPLKGDEPLLARFGPGIFVQQGVSVIPGEGYWDVRLTWQMEAPVSANYTCSLRFLDANGALLAQRDFAEGPGYGFWPTSAWAVGEQWTDRLRVAVPAGVRAADAAAMSVVLYDRSQPGYPAAGTVIVPLGEHERRFVPPKFEIPVNAVFGDQIELLGVDLAQEATVLRLGLHWQAGERWAEEWRVAPDYVVFVHLYDPATETIVAQSDARPCRGVYPTTSWAPGEVVSEEIVLDLGAVSAGRYRLGLGMVEANSRDRALIVDAQGEPLPGGRLVLESEVVVR